MVESLMSLAIAATLLGTAVPSFEEARLRRHLDGAAAQLRTDIHELRSLGIAQNRNLRLSFKTDAGGTCYLIHSGSASDCSCSADGKPVCSGSAEGWRGVRFPAAGPVKLTSNVASMTFDSTLGTTSPTGTIKLLARDARGINVVVNIMGRARSCSPGAALPGYPTC